MREVSQLKDLRFSESFVPTTYHDCGPAKTLDCLAVHLLLYVLTYSYFKRCFTQALPGLYGLLYRGDE